MSILLGLDVSTTGAKAVLINGDGAVLASVTHEYPLSVPRPLWSEQSPEAWWQAMSASIRGALSQSGIHAQEIGAVGLTGQMHGLVMLDESGQVLRPAILWNDQRTGPQCQAIMQTLGEAELIAETGNRALPAFTAGKILWVRDEEPEVYARCRQVLLPKDYIRYRLTGEYATDRAGASGTLLLNVKERDWSHMVTEGLGIPKEWLPKTHEGTEITGAVSRAAADATGLRTGTPVVGGGSDQSVQAVGVGAVTPSVGALTLGTSGVIFVSTDRYMYDPQGLVHGFCHAVPNQWHLMTSVQSAGGSLRWYRDTVAPGVGYDQLLAAAAHAPIGCDGLLFLPYLTGERTPHTDPLARGCFMGLTLQHGPGHLSRAVLEGVAFGLRDNLLLLQGVGAQDMTELRISGGGARSPLWAGILANVLQAELATINATEGAAFGAALLAGVGAGVWPDVQRACQSCIRVTGRISPTGPEMERYEDLYQIYRELYPATRQIAHRLSALAA